MSKGKGDFILPVPQGSPTTRQAHSRVLTAAIALAALACSTILLTRGGHLTESLLGNKGYSSPELDPFYHTVNTHDDLCVGGVSHSGYIGLQGDTEDTPKRSFYWYVS